MTPWLVGIIYEYARTPYSWLAASALATACTAFFSCERYRRTRREPAVENIVLAALLSFTGLANYGLSGSLADTSFANLFSVAGVGALLVGRAFGFANLALAGGLLALFAIGQMVDLPFANAIPKHVSPFHDLLNFTGALFMAPAVLYGVFELRRLPEAALIQRNTELEAEQTKKTEIAARCDASDASTASGLALGVGHQINNHLTALIGDLQFLEAELDSTQDPSLQAFASAKASLISDALESAWAAANDVTLLSCLRSGDSIVSMNASKAIERSVQLLPSMLRRKAKIHVDIQKELIVKGDATRLLTALTELLRNAILATSDGGETSHDVRISAVREGDSIVIEINDSGCGMTHQILSRCREPFFSTRAIGAGTGMGLTKAWNTIEAMAGTLDLQSRAGGGTQATIHLPASSPANEFVAVA
jgi:signal transduction histidine kinase